MVYALEHKIAVFMVVAVIGSTKESAIDDIAQIFALKPKYEAKVAINKKIDHV